MWCWVDAVDKDVIWHLRRKILFSNEVYNSKINNDDINIPINCTGDSIATDINLSKLTLIHVLQQNFL